MTDQSAIATVKQLPEIIEAQEKYYAGYELGFNATLRTDTNRWQVQVISYDSQKNPTTLNWFQVDNCTGQIVCKNELYTGQILSREINVCINQ